MRTFFPVLLGLVVLGLLEGLFYVVRFVRERKRAQLQRRLRSLGRGQPAGSILLRAGRLSSIGFVNDLLQPLQFARYLERLLEQADADITVAQLLAFSLVGGVLGALLGVLGNVGLVLIVLFGAIGFCIPFVILLLARSDRSRKVSEQLPEALEMMTRSLRAGHALETAFQLVASEAPSPINLEFARAYEEQRLGRTLEQTVVGMTQRVPNNPDLNIFAVSVSVQKETGGNLSEILEKIAETIRARFRFYGKLRALTAEGRVSGLILGALPVGMLILLVVGNWDYIKVLFEERDGNMILLTGFVLWLVGLVWLQRLAKVEY